MLTQDDLAYMRETRAQARPTEAHLQRRTTTRSPSGGSVTTWQDPGDPVGVRIDPVDPTEVEGDAADYQVKITMDLVADVRDGDHLAVSPTEVYELTTDGNAGAWTTALVVYGRRIAHRTR